MTVSLIVAMAENGVIGRKGGLPWRLPKDLKRFKALTMGHTLVLGRRTWESIGRLLPGRAFVVVSRDPAFSGQGIRVSRSVREAIEQAGGDTEVFIGGGAEIYRQALPIADRIYLTRVHARVEGDTYFPEVDWGQWREVSREEHQTDEKHLFPFTFLVYERENSEGLEDLSPSRRFRRFSRHRLEFRHLKKSLQETYAPANRCFGCGPANEMGLRIRSFVEGDALVAEWRAQEHHQAFPGILNGGIAGALLDCHSNWTAAYHLMKQRGADSPPCTVTADFHVILKRPTPMEVPMMLRARVVESNQDRAVVEATLEAAGKVTATCRGTFVAVTEGHPAFHRW